MSISLLQSLYLNASLKRTDYGPVLAEFEHFGITAQVYHLLKQLNRLDEMPIEVVERLKSNYEKVYYLNFLLKKETELLLAALADEGIKAIPLKGAFFSAKYFGDFSARPSTDIDLLIRKRDLIQAIKIVKKRKFTRSERYIPGHFHLNFNKEMPASSLPLTVELHWDLIKSKTAKLKIERFWEEAETFESHLELSNYHTFYMICLHGWKHNMDSLKYFIDIIQMIHLLGGELDYKRLLREAREDGTKRRVTRTLSLVYSLFPHLHQLKPFPEMTKPLFWDFDQFMNYPYKSLKRYADFVDYQLCSYDGPWFALNSALTGLWNELAPIEKKRHRTVAIRLVAAGKKGK